MNRPIRKITWLAVGAGSALAAGQLVEKSLDAGWRAATSHDPPDKPQSLRTSWKDALLWTAVSALVIGVAQIAARRGAEVGWRQVTGRKPPQ